MMYTIFFNFSIFIDKEHYFDSVVKEVSDITVLGKCMSRRTSLGNEGVLMDTFDSTVHSVEVYHSDSTTLKDDLLVLHAMEG